MKTRVIILSCLALSFLLSDCKKGEGDPLFTLSSRKIRLAGKWKVTHYLLDVATQNHSPLGTGNTLKQTTEIRDGIVSTTYFNEFPSGGGSTSFSSGQAGMSFIFATNGSYTQTTEYRDVVSFNSGSNTQNSETTVLTGKWSFMRKEKNAYKNKERLLLEVRDKKLVKSFESGGKMNTLLQTNTFPPGTMTEIWTLHTLKSRLLIMNNDQAENFLHINAVNSTTFSTQNLQISKGNIKVEMQQ